MPKNYYVVLGIPSTSSQEEIKTAYRRLAKEFHPDRYGEGHSPFQVIQEAIQRVDPGKHVTLLNFALAGYKQPQQLMVLNYYLKS